MWNKGAFNLLHIAAWAIKHLEGYQCCHPSLSKNLKRQHTPLVSPPSGRMKINVDGASRTKEEKGGIGVVVRDEHGQYLAVFARHIPYASSSF